jgi:hypothetical protein
MSVKDTTWNFPGFYKPRAKKKTGVPNRESDLGLGPNDGERSVAINGTEDRGGP